MPAAARGKKTDKIVTYHEGDMFTETDECSGDVFVNSIGAVRKNDFNNMHLEAVVTGTDDEGNEIIELIPHKKQLTTCSKSVFINSRGAGRLGDYYEEEKIITGSPNVFIGG